MMRWLFKWLPLIAGGLVFVIGLEGILVESLQAFEATGEYTIDHTGLVIYTVFAIGITSVLTIVKEICKGLLNKEVNK